MTVEPITPDAVPGAKKEYLPDAVLETFNELIIEKWNGHRALIAQQEIVRRLMTKMDLLPEERQMIFSKGYLEVEDIYRQAGWEVTYDKPGYNENYDASFEFKRPSKSMDR